MVEAAGGREAAEEGDAVVEAAGGREAAIGVEATEESEAVAGVLLLVVKPSELPTPSLIVEGVA